MSKAKITMNIYSFSKKLRKKHENLKKCIKIVEKTGSISYNSIVSIN